MSYSGWGPYVSVAERKINAAKHVSKLKKQGKSLNPILIEGRKIASTFWGIAWCENLESYSDYENRLPRGRTYVRNGSVIDLQISNGKINAQVMGSSLYKVTIQILQMTELKWKNLSDACSKKIDSIIELLQGKFSKSVMEILTQKEMGLFPKPKEIKMSCSCPDFADMCKHVAAVLYGVGSSLDRKPEWLFELRNVDHLDLIAKADSTNAFLQGQLADESMDDSELSSLFGIEMDSSSLKVPLVNLIEKTKPVKVKEVKLKKNAKPIKAVLVKEVKLKEKTKPVKAVKVKAIKVKEVKLKKNAKPVS